MYCDPGNLVIVLNATENEEKYYRTKLNDSNIYGTTYSTNTTERFYVKYYMFGLSYVSLLF